MLLENVLEELATCYLAAVCSKESSIFLEKIIEFGDDAFALKFSLDFVGRSWVSIITSPYAARVFETSLKVLGKSSIGKSHNIDLCFLLKPYVEIDRIEELISWFDQEADWPTLVQSQYASQSIKRLIDCINDYPTLVKKKIALRHSILQKLNIDEAVMTTYGSSLIQYLLLDSYHKDGVDHEVLPPKGSDPILRVVKHSQAWEDGNGSVDFQIVFTYIVANSDRFETFIRHQGASHLLEVLLFIAPRTSFTEIWQNHFRTKLSAKIKHPVANFVVQKLIECCRNEGQFRLIYDELKDIFPELLQGRTGVLVKLFQGALKYSESQKEMIKLLISSLSESQENEALQKCRKDIANLLILMKNTPRNVFKKKKQRKESKFSALGCQVLTELFKFDSTLNGFVITSFISLESDIFLELCVDIAGSRVVESFFLSSAVGVKQKQTLIENLIKAESIGKLALDKSGSYVLEKCFNVAEIKKKERILKQLINIEDQLKESPQGRFALKFCNVDMYKQKKDSWLKTEESNTKKKDMLHELLDEFDQETSKMKKRKREEQGKDNKKDKGKEKKVKM